MARRRRGGSAGSSTFTGWATPMVEKKKHATDPYIDPDNGPGRPRTGQGMFNQIIPGKTAGYKIGTGGNRDDNKWYRDGSKQ